jgi:choline dehydrogenase-like flavoprotein
MRKLIIGVAGLAIVLLLGAWVLSPVFAMQALTRAAEQGDEAALERLVDFPAVRQSLKDELNARMMAEMRNGESEIDPAWAGVGMLLGPAIVSGAIDAVITPQGVATMVRTAEAPEPADVLNRPEASPGETEDDVRKSWTYRGANRVEVRLTTTDRPDQPLILNMDRNGLFGWRLVEIDLPDA